jgi:hypothetical protein
MSCISYNPYAVYKDSEMFDYFEKDCNDTNIHIHIAFALAHALILFVVAVRVYEIERHVKELKHMINNLCNHNSIFYDRHITKQPLELTAINHDLLYHDLLGG